MTQTEALRLAFEALHYCEALNSSVEKQKMQAITAIKAALEAKDEPVAWGVFEDGNIHDAFTTKQEAHHMAYLKGTHAEARPLYTAPPQRKPLTDEEITDLYFDGFSISKLTEFARAIEAAHGIKE